MQRRNRYNIDNPKLEKMKLNIYLLSSARHLMFLIAMMSGVLLNSCTEEEMPVPMNIATVRFSSDAYTIEQFSTDAFKITLPLSLPLEEAGKVVVELDNSSTAAAENYTITPATESGSLTFNLEKGALEASFIVTSANNFADDVTLVFKITSATGGVTLDKSNTTTTITMSGNNPTIPEIITSVAALETFGKVRNGAISVSKSYTVSGRALKSDIMVMASDSYQISLDDVTFDNSLTINYRNANTAPVTVYVRFTPATGLNQPIPGTIIHSVDGVPDKVVQVSGSENGNIIPAVLYLNENFDYGSSAGNLTAVSGGSWVNFSGTTVPVKYIPQGLTFNGYAGSAVGGAIISENGSGSREDLYRTFPTQSSGVLYISFLMNISTAASGDFLTSLRDPAAAYFNRLYVKDVGGSPSIGLARASATVSYANTSLSYGTTYLVVSKYDFTTQRSSLYIVKGAIPEDEPDTPDAVATDGTPPASVTNIIIRQNTTVLTATMDGMRISNTWAGAVLGLGL